ncbi:SDR family oxidoreductase [Gluconacetobacter azotocaptans]|uniref:SDR family oxidoreductase n=1 Tax=Gluconacetobacter azotocaptans TaxID=142834 RepID=UPI00195A2394|nr:SDR family oxidoreductase [Gluconacetobacter azotocaptans]MBM9401662.1 SDR family oxidoreductase [Gluconacetobacter azotocaptans]
MSENNGTSRRGIMQGAVAGMAAVAAPAFGQDRVTQAAPPVDPRGLYPHAPFKAQPQPWPGLASRMVPHPDHGERSYRGSGRLAGRKALITGGDSGLGRAAAIAYAREGADVAINYLPQEESDAHEVAGLIRAAGRKVVSLPGDIRSETFCASLVDRAATELGGLDIFVNCAGRQHTHDDILDVSTEDFDWTLKTNLYALFWLTKAAIAHMKPGSAMIFTASTNAYNPSVNILDYSITKAGIANYAKGLAKQLIAKGIRVNAIAPGPFWTPLQVSGGQTMENVEKFGEDVPMGRPGQPAELAPVYVQLASTEASYITGQVVGVTGGVGVP